MSGPRLSIIPAGAIFDRSLEPRDLQVLALLGMYTDKAGWCRRSQVKMAAQLKCGRSSVQRSLENLVTAGWVEKKRPPWSSGEGQPSNSYMYRVVLDRDDDSTAAAAASDDDSSDVGDTHAEIAMDEADCPPVGTLSEDVAEAAEPEKNIPETAAGGAQLAGHPGAQPYVGTGAQPYVGTKNDPLERPLLEREREARARDRTGKFLAAFEAKWPSAVADDRQRTAYAADALTEAEQAAALAGIPVFIDSLKRLGRKNVPAGWRYLEEKRWTLLEAAAAAITRTPTSHAPDSVEAKAILVLFKIVQATSFFYSTIARGGTVNYRVPVTPRFAALAQAGPAGDWPELSYRQAAAWEALLRDLVTVQVRKHLKAGDRAPWLWPPLVDGNPWTETTGPPDVLMTEADAAEFR